MNRIEDIDIGYEIGKKAGIKEAVDWFQKYYIVNTRTQSAFCIPTDELDAKLKEWGVSNDWVKRRVE